MIQELGIDKLRRNCDPEYVGCTTSAEVNALETIIGQERAVRSLHFGLDIKDKGFNIYVAGLPGTGRTTAIERFLKEVAEDKPVPPDWCYVNNFRDNYLPNVLRLPAGSARQFQKDIESLVRSTLQAIRTTFESEEYAAHREETLKTFQQQKQAILERVNELARQEGFLLQPTPMGLATIPLRKGKPLSEEEFLAMSQAEQDEIGQRQQKIQAALEASIRQTKGLDKGAQEALQKLDREVARYELSHPIEDLKEKYADLPEVLAYIDEVQDDVLENVNRYKSEPGEQAAPLGPDLADKALSLNKYRVNVLVDNSASKGAPVVLERHPTYSNLFGRIEQEAQFGALVTDFSLIRRGSLHRANGGYLVLPVEDVLLNPFTWESLKRSLINSEIVIEEPVERPGFATKSLRPEPIPLDTKVILIGRPDVYQVLLAYDENFRELFKVKADFDTQMPRTEEHIREYAAFVHTLCEAEHLKDLDSTALPRIVEYGSRLAEDQGKLSTRFGEISDVIREANYYANQQNSQYVTGDHIVKAIEERLYRSALVHERIQVMIARGVIKIDVSGDKVGQVNGLSVMELGDIAFGAPSRITASVGLGREGIVDIEREAKLGGPIHTKGVLILSGYLAEKYAQDKPLSLAARLVFEQSYSGVEGDSASSAELYAILSALSGLPVKQSIAVTGSVNQMGEVQAIGGVNEKIEGFFAVCQAAGLTGSQGVMIPESNVSNLMLKETVVEAVRQGKFHIWPVKTIDQGVEVLTSVKAGQRLENGTFEPDSLNDRVDRRLRAFAQKMTQFSGLVGKEAVLS
jgi:lon-related putative ATP-dependent protease